MKKSFAIPKPHFDLVIADTQKPIIFSRDHFEASSRWAFHQVYELHLVTESNGKFFVGDYVGDFGPGQLTLIGPNLPHKWICSETQKIRKESSNMLLHFSQEFIDKLIQAFPGIQNVKTLCSQSKNGIEFYDEKILARVADLLKGMETLNNCGRLANFLSILELLTNSNQYKFLCSEFYESPVKTQTSRKLNYTINFVMKNFKRDISLNEAARALDMKPSNFSRYFKKISGKGFVEFVSAMRIDEACRLLINTDSPITEICFSVGFGNISNFNRHFSKLKGMTPSQYRKQFELCYKNNSTCSLNYTQ